MTTFAVLFVPARPREAVSDAAWLAAMLHVERALAHAESRIGVVPAEAAAAIADCCDPTLYDIERLCEEGRAVGNPAEPLARALRERVGGDAARFVHFGATSQDVLDTAAMLVARDARALIEEERRCRARVRTAGAGGSRDADGGAHAAARSGADDVRAQGGRLACRHARGAGAPHYRGARPGEAAGRLAALGESGTVQTQAAVLTRGEHEHERAAGAWHAKWGALSNALALAGGAAAAIRECLEHLEVHTERMRENMSAALVAERVAFTLDRETAVRAFASGDPRRALEGREELLDPTTYLGSAEAFVDRALERHERGG